MRISDWSSDVCSSDLFEQIARMVTRTEIAILVAAHRLRTTGEVILPRWHVVIAVAVDITHRAVDLGRELPEQRHVLLRAVADVVVLEITTRQRDVGSQRMHRAARREERAVARVVADAGARLPGEELGAVVDDETQACIRTSSEERRGGKECVRTCRSRWAPAH